MSLFLFFTVLQAIVATALVGVILMQRSEGGGLGIGGSPGGLMGARGAADFLTRTTRWLAIAFVALSIALAAIAVETTGTQEITTTLDRAAPSAPTDPLAPVDPLAPGATGSDAGAAAAGANADPLANQAS